MFRRGLSIYLVLMLTVGALIITPIAANAGNSPDIYLGNDMPHVHNWGYLESGSSIIASCTGTCPDGYDNNGILLSLRAPNNLAADGTEKTVTIDGYPSSVPDNLAAEPSVVYYHSTGQNSVTPSGNALTAVPVEVGDYVVQMTWGGKTASLAFTVIPVPVSGTCGKTDGNVLWAVSNPDSNGHYTTLTISPNTNDPVGTDYDMNENYDFSSPPPWYGHSQTITTVIVSYGVTSIGNSAFRDFPVLTAVNMAGSVKKIGEFAFENCISLTSAPIGAGVTEIRDCAFRGCNGITSVSIPDGVYLNEQVFSACEGLTTVTIPASLTHFNAMMFDDCIALQSYTVDDNNAFYTDIDGVVLSKNEEVFVAYPFGRSGAYTVPSGVKTIASGAFAGCPGITAVVLPEGVTSIEDGALCNCKNLASITLPDSITKIDAGALDGTAWRNSQPDGMAYIGSVAYHIIGQCPANLVIKNGIRKINPSACFGFDELKTLVIPSSVTWIGDGAFADCINLETVYLLPGTAPVLQGNGLGFDGIHEPCCFYVHGNEYETRWSALWQRFADQNIHYVKTVIWALDCGEGITAGNPIISNAGTDYYTEGSDVLLNHTDAVEGFLFGGYWVDGGLISSDSIKMPASDTLVTIFWRKSLTNKDITVSVPGQTYTGEALQPVLTVKDGETVLTADKDYTVSWLRDGKTVSDFILTGDYTATITGIGDYAEECTVVYTIMKAEPAVVAPKAITGLVANGSEQELVEAGSATGGTMQYTLGKDATAAPTSGWATAVPKGKDSGTYYAWYQVVGDECYNDVKPACIMVDIKAPEQQPDPEPENPTSPETDPQIPAEPDVPVPAEPDKPAPIEPDAPAPGTDPEPVEENCTITFEANGGTGVMDPVKVKKGSAYRLPECGFTAPDGKVFDQWDQGAVETEIAVTTDLTIKAMWKDKPAEQITVTSNGAVCEINTSTGTAVCIKPEKNDVKLLEVPDEITVEGISYPVTEIAPKAFKGMKKLKTVKIGKNIEKIGYSAFQNCTALTKIIIPGKVTVIEKNTFSGCKKLASVTIGKKVTEIGVNAFRKCIALTKITIPAKVKKVGKEAFFGCKKLKTITIKTTLLKKNTIGKNCFKGIYAKAAFKCPKKSLKNYRKWLLNPGKAPKTVKFK